MNGTTYDAGKYGSCRRRERAQGRRWKGTLSSSTSALIGYRRPTITSCNGAMTFQRNKLEANIQCKTTVRQNVTEWRQVPWMGFCCSFKDMAPIGESHYNSIVTCFYWCVFFFHLSPRSGGVVIWINKIHVNFSGHFFVARTHKRCTPATQTHTRVHTYTEKHKWVNKYIYMLRIHASKPTQTHTDTNTQHSWCGVCVSTEGRKVQKIPKQRSETSQF